MTWIIALLVSGVAAGMFLMDVVAYYPVLPRLPGPAAIEFHQHAVALRRVVFRIMVGGSGLTTLVLAVLFSDAVSRRLLIIHLICLVALVLYTNWALISLNREIAAWIPASPPRGWELRFSRMIVLEQLRGLLPACAFLLDLVAYAVRRNGFLA